MPTTRPNAPPLRGAAASHALLFSLFPGRTFPRKRVYRYWSVVENRRVAGGRVVQRHVLYLGEINSSQEFAWRRSIEVLEDGESAPRTYALLPDESIERLKLRAMQLHRPRQWGACWQALTLWQILDLDVFWAERLPPSRKGTRWDLVLLVWAAYRLIAPGQRATGAVSVRYAEGTAHTIRNIHPLPLALASGHES